MIKAIFLMIEPGAAWDRIVLARRSFGYVFAVYLMPMLLVLSFVEGFGLWHWGKLQARINMVEKFTLNKVVTYEVLQLILMLAVILICACLIEKFSQTFHTRSAYTQAFTVVAYGLSPMFFFRLFDALPTMSFWITWVLGVMLSMWILYQGLPRVLTPDPTHAFGLYLITCIVLFLSTALVRLPMALYLQGSVDLSHSFLARKILHTIGQ